jgi:aspartate carbamoyltransferase
MQRNKITHKVITNFFLINLFLSFIKVVKCKITNKLYNRLSICGKVNEMMCSPLSFHFFYVTLKAEEILYLSKKKSEMENRSLVTIADHSKEKIMYLLRMAGEFEKHTNRKLLEGKVVATLFFEPSTRTRLSFETAANRLGARVIGFTDPKVTSSTKGETLKDTIMMVSNYADLIVMRHYLEGAARYASEVSPVPIINAGDGANQHPSQTMLDLYSIYKTQGTLDNLQIYMVGDLKYGRTVHSLLMAMRHFNPTFHFIAPEELKMPDVYKQYCDIHHIKYVEHTDFTADTIAGADILYMTRVQKERFTDLMEYERVKDLYLLKLSMLKKAKDNMRILHPLPRVNEIEYAIDDDPHAYYFEQAHNGLFARQALICDALGLTLDDVINDRTIID